MHNAGRGDTMRISLAIGAGRKHENIREVVETAALADRLGFWALTLTEHVAIPGSERTALGPRWYDPIVPGSAIATATERIRIRYNVLVLPYHNPLRLAKQVATLDELSGGRVDLGIGTGWMEAEFRMLGAEWERRGAYTDEALEVMRALWTEDPASFEGQFFRFRDAVSFPKPVQKPHPPLWIG